MCDRLVNILGSHRLGTLAVLAVMAGSAFGCVVEAEAHTTPTVGYSGTAGTGGYSEPITQAQIDTDQTLTTKPGEGAGVFIEYNSGGYWHVFTACDSKLYGDSCVWNVIATVQQGLLISDVTIVSAEATDGDAVYPSKDSVELSVETWNDFDEMRFTTKPGAVVRFDVYLGGQADARYIYWVGQDAIHKGAPSDPIDLKPSTP